MNIFVLDERPLMAAQHHCDKHVVKMCLEYTQIICTVLRMKGIDHPELYKRTHEAHPCVVWAAINRQNFDWLCKLTGALFQQFELRYEKMHKSSRVFHLALALYARASVSLFRNSDKRTPFVKCMPAEYKVLYSDAVNCYRLYYILEKRAICRWRNEKPEWVVRFEANTCVLNANGKSRDFVVENIYRKGTLVQFNGVQTFELT